MTDWDREAGPNPGETCKPEEQVPISTGGDDIRQFLSEIRIIPRLTPQEERELAQRCAQGDEDAIRKMVSANLRLVVSIAREYAGRGVPLMDLIQEGSMGLIAAARKFDCSLDFRFSTYATKWIRQGVTRCILNHGSTIRVPIHTAERMRKLEGIRTGLRQDLGREPTTGELAEAMELPEEKVDELIRLTPDICSLDVPTGDDDKGTLGMLLEDESAPEPQEALARQEMDDAIDRLMGSLNPRQQKILRLRYGMEDGKCYSLEEIGGMLGISKERVRQVERQAMDKMQKLGSVEGLEDFLE